MHSSLSDESGSSESDSDSYSESDDSSEMEQPIVQRTSVSTLAPASAPAPSIARAHAPLPGLNQLAEHVKKWTILDHQLKIVYEKTKKMREYKTQLGKEIIEYMENRQKLKSKIQITNGELSFYEKKEYGPLTFAFLEKSLAEIIPDKTHVDFIMEYLKQKRSVKCTTEIRRKMHTPPPSLSIARHI